MVAVFGKDKISNSNNNTFYTVLLMFQDKLWLYHTNGHVHFLASRKDYAVITSYIKQPLHVNVFIKVN